MRRLFLYDGDEMLRTWNDIDPGLRDGIDVARAPAAPEELIGVVAGYDTCINDASFFTRNELQKCSDLRHIVFLGTGASSFIDLDAANSHGIKVSTIKGYGDLAVAEHTLGLVFAAARETAAMDRKIRSGGWGPVEGIELRGKTMGIVGFGGIGLEVARLAGAIGMKVLVWNRSPIPAEFTATETIDELLSSSDVVSLHLALTDETQGIISNERLQKFKQGSLLVNTARAALVDKQGLIDALNGGKIRHAAFDVFEPEPPNPDDPFLQLENMTLSSHASAMTPDATKKLLLEAIRHSALDVSGDQSQ